MNPRSPNIFNEYLMRSDTSECLQEEYENSTPNTDNDPINLLKNIKEMNMNRIIIAHLNINSIRNKFDALKTMMNGNIDILLITSTMLDESFSSLTICNRGYKHPFRLDHTSDGGDGGGGGGIIFV